MKRGDALIALLPQGPCRVVEIGVWEGKLMDYVLARRDDVFWIGIDKWCETDSLSPYYQSGDPLARWSQNEALQCMDKANRIARHYDGRVQLYHLESVVAAEIIACDFDVLFIDGDHSGWGVSTDLKTWVPKINPGGMVSGHDYNKYRTVRQAVNDYSHRIGAPIAVNAEADVWHFRRPT